MTATAANALTTPAARADTRPDIHIHPRSASATGRALFYASAARRLIVSAREHRKAGRADWARGAIALASIAIQDARSEYRTAHRGG